MNNIISEILNKPRFIKSDIVSLLQADEDSTKMIFSKAAEIKKKHIGNITYYRGLIELSNICYKDCYYCGIRNANDNIGRYQVLEDEIMDAVKYAIDKKWGSIVIQSGERQDAEFTSLISDLLYKIQDLSNGELGITLSCGEQDIETYKKWYAAGATRYLLRIETSQKDLYCKLHPKNKHHDFEKRLQSIYNLKKIGFITGTGVMIGLPFQTIEDLAEDLIFMQELDIDMCGMGPYLEHDQTPLYSYRNLLFSRELRCELTLKMIAILRILMKDVNIASTTALQVIAPNGRKEGIRVGANVIMPNITPRKYNDNYSLYEGKNGSLQDEDLYLSDLEEQIRLAGDEVGYNKKGDPKHFLNR